MICGGTIKALAICLSECLSAETYNPKRHKWRIFMFSKNNGIYVCMLDNCVYLFMVKTMVNIFMYVKGSEWYVFMCGKENGTYICMVKTTVHIYVR